MLIKKILFLASILVITACLPQLIARSQRGTTSSTTPGAPITAYFNFLPLLLGYQGSAITPSPGITSTPTTGTPTTPEPTTSTTPTTPDPTTSTTPTTPEPTSSTTPTTPEPTDTTPAPTPISGAIVADHYAIDEFETIPASALDAAAAIDTLFKHQSTGQYIYIDGLLCLAGERGEGCDIYPQFPYDNDNWIWSVWDVPMSNGDLKTDQWVDVVNAQQEYYDVLGMKFCYVDSWNLHFDYYRLAMEQLEQAYPQKIFIWTTAALIAESVVSQPGGHEMAADLQAFNQQLRDYAYANNKILYDLADMESHDPEGNACIADGFEALCQEYYRDGGGHPNVPASIRLAKGFWWLMARIGGWEGN